ncbi:hypothetical protein NC652_038386 [Populus alba x Populus x berolinensis]|nr:hypothetical protein NC652_038386 [Populus alba x Populus x berolinensis]
MRDGRFGWLHERSWRSMVEAAATTTTIVTKTTATSINDSHQRQQHRRQQEPKVCHNKNGFAGLFHFDDGLGSSWSVAAS